MAKASRWMGDIEDDRECLSDGEGIEMDGIRHGMDGAASGASSELKRLDTRLLAETDSSQHEQHERGTAHVPEPHHLPSTTDDPSSPSVHPVSTETSKQELDKSVRPEREDSLTTSNGHVVAVSDDLEVTDIPHRHGARYLRWLLTCVTCCRAEELRSCIDGQYNR